MKEIVTSFKEAFSKWSGEPCMEAGRLPASGSERSYWRLKGPSMSAIGVHHPVKEETRAFLAFTEHFRKHGLHVPEVYLHDKRNNLYLISDLGDVTLFSLLGRNEGNEVNTEIFRYFEKALEELVRFQVLAGKDLDYSHCYPRQAFDRQSVAWDLNYFKYNFLKLQAHFNEQKLEDDFLALTDFLMEAPSEYFMYRDFQSRNIMVHQGSLYFIDYQGGRKGPLQYDPVSLLYQVKADLPSHVREELLQHYLKKLGEITDFDEEQFLKYYEGFILLRLLQVLGSYGFRGLIQKKAHFVSSIPYAMKNLRWFLGNHHLPVPLPELIKALKKVSGQERFHFTKDQARTVLTVEIKSFAYKYGIPEDYSGHGGGFVFDCRALPNPGREESMRAYNGRNDVIRNYLAACEEVPGFLNNVYGLVDRAVEHYLQRGFNCLMVSFGCTGGQHRSVYCAEQLKAHLVEKFPEVTVNLGHRELNSLK